MRLVTRPSKTDLFGHVPYEVKAFCLKSIRHRGKGEETHWVDPLENEEIGTSNSAEVIRERLFDLRIITKSSERFIEGYAPGSDDLRAIEIFLVDPKSLETVQPEYRWLCKATLAANKAGFEVAFVSGDIKDQHFQARMKYNSEKLRLEQLAQSSGLVVFNGETEVRKILILPRRQLFDPRVDPMTAASMKVVFAEKVNPSMEMLDTIARTEFVGRYGKVSAHRLSRELKSNPLGEGSISGLDLASENFVVCNYQFPEFMPPDFPESVERYVRKEIAAASLVPPDEKVRGHDILPLGSQLDASWALVEAVSVSDRSEPLFFDSHYFEGGLRADWSEIAAAVTNTASVLKTQQYESSFGHSTKKGKSIRMRLPNNYWRAGIVKVEGFPNDLYLELKGCGSVEPIANDPGKDGKLRLESAIREVFADRLIRLSLSHPLTQYKLRSELCPDGELRTPVDTVGIVGLIMLHGCDVGYHRSFPFSKKSAILVRPMHCSRAELTNLQKVTIEDTVFGPLGFGSSAGVERNIQSHVAPDGTIHLVDFGTFEPFTEPSRHTLRMPFVGEESWISNPYLFDTMLKVIADDLGDGRITWAQVDSYFDQILRGFRDRMIERWGPFKGYI